MEQFTVETKKTKWRVYLAVVVAVVILAGGSYAYYWVTSTSQLRVEASALIDDHKRLRSLEDNLLNEQRRCEQYVIADEGNFAEFEYCQRFLDWLDLNVNVDSLRQ